MISVDVYKESVVHCDAGVAHLERVLEAHESVFWVDVSQPTPEEWQTIERVFQFHPLAIEDAQHQNQRAKVEVYDAYIFLSLRIWTGMEEGLTSLPAVTDEIDIFFGENYLLTIHNKEIPDLDAVRKRWEKKPDLLHRHAAFLLYLLLDVVVDRFFPALDEITDVIDEIETRVYASEGDLNITPAMVLKRRLLLLRQTVAPTRDVMSHLLRLETSLIPSSVHLYFQDVYDHTLHLVEQVDLHRDMLAGALDAMIAQTSNRLNQVMKTMTGVSTILMTAALVAGIYGMNFEGFHEIHWKYGYEYSLGLMLGLSVILAWFFRKIKWF